MLDLFSVFFVEVADAADDDREVCTNMEDLVLLTDNAIEVVLVDTECNDADEDEVNTGDDMLELSWEDGAWEALVNPLMLLRNRT